MKLKICTTCKIEKEITQFRRDRARKDGRQSHCKLCARNRHKEGYTNKYGQRYKDRNLLRASNNRKKFQDFKQTLNCIMCNENTPACLEFHHVNEKEKSVNVSASMACSWSTITNEIRKCVPICSNCHKKFHAGLITLPFNINQLRCTID